MGFAERNLIVNNSIPNSRHSWFKSLFSLSLKILNGPSGVCGTHPLVFSSSSFVFGWGSPGWVGEFIGHVPDCSFTRIFFFQSRFIILHVFMPVAFQAKIAGVIFFRGSGRRALPAAACWLQLWVSNSWSPFHKGWAGGCTRAGLRFMLGCCLSPAEAPPFEWWTWEELALTSEWKDPDSPPLPTWLLTCSVFLDELLHLSGPQFPYMQNTDNSYLMKLLLQFSVIVYLKGNNAFEKPGIQ